MIVKEITNIEDIKAILCHEDIYDTITADGSVKADKFEPPLDDHVYVGGYHNGEIFALLVYHPFRDGNKCHVQVLKSHRAEFAKEFGEKAILFRGKKPLYAVIPDLYKNVLDFSFVFGFEVIEKTEKTYLKNGIAYDDNILRLKDGIS